MLEKPEISLSVKNGVAHSSLPAKYKRFYKRIEALSASLISTPSGEKAP
jgi:lambda repressor-like predicted transcriptional regulator